jgi:hypothetical protein
MHVVVGSNPGAIKIIFLSCSRHVVILHYTKNYFSKVLYFLKTFHHTSLYGPTASGARADPSSQVCSSTMLVLPILDNCKVRFEGSPQWHNVNTKFHPNLSSGS